MEISTFIGYIFTILLLILGRGLLHRRPKDPEEEKQKETLNQFLKSLNVEMGELDEEEAADKAMPRVSLKKPPQPAEKAKQPRKAEDKLRFQTPVEQHRFEANGEKRKRDLGATIVNPNPPHSHDAYARALAETQQPSRALELILRLGSKKNMVILQEILNPPKAFNPTGYQDRY